MIYCLKTMYIRYGEAFTKPIIPKCIMSKNALAALISIYSDTFKNTMLDTVMHPETYLGIIASTVSKYAYLDASLNGAL